MIPGHVVESAKRERKSPRKNTVDSEMAVMRGRSNPGDHIRKYNLAAEPHDRRQRERMAANLSRTSYDARE